MHSLSENLNLNLHFYDRFEQRSRTVGKVLDSFLMYFVYFPSLNNLN